MALSTAAVTAPRAAPSKAATATRGIIANPRAEGGAVVVFNQTANPTNSGVIAMRNLDAGAESYDAQLADDFVVPVGGWAVSQVRIGSFFQDTSSNPVTPPVVGNITFHTQVAGGPGPAVAGCTYTGIALSYDAGSSYSTLNLPTECALSMGTHWKSFSADLSFQAQNGGVYVRQQSNSPGSSAVWRNPGSGFGQTCSNWTMVSSCGFPAGGMTLQLLGRLTPISLQSYEVD